jgi:predicted ATP-grasp superfamily ATP-dependent carboligase
VDSLQRRNLRPVVVLLMAQSFGGRHGNEELARSLAERNVPVCPVYCDADLSETLSSFSANTFSQESSWRRPVLSHLT